MARKPAKTEAASSAPEIEPDATYDVTPARVFDAGGVRMRPRHTYEVRGRVVAEIPADAIAALRKR